MPTILFFNIRSHPQSSQGEGRNKRLKPQALAPLLRVPPCLVLPVSLASTLPNTASSPIFYRHFAGVSGFFGSVDFDACTLASASSTRFLKSPWSLCESPLYIETTLISHLVPIGARETLFLP